MLRDSQNGMPVIRGFDDSDFIFFHGRSWRHVLPERTVAVKTIISAMYIKSGKSM
ncbi:MAG: hypothetical protein II189_05435 [Lachnospiraceae bacterium]|nr:hypothetical protein [Lachnospiraceae bacterium]